MTRCYITLDELPPSNRNPRMKDAAARALYDTATFDGRLACTRRGLFVQGVRFTEGMSISGVQQKLSMRLDADSQSLVPTEQGGRYILKPSPDPFPYCSEMEHLGMRLSQLVGIETALCGLVEFEDGERAYLTRRFDRHADGTIAVEAMEDLCSLCEMHRQDKYDSSYEAAGRVLFEAVGGKLAVMNDYFRRILFAYLIGNDDLHLKNLSVIRRPGNTGGSYDCLAPNYDVVPTVTYHQGGRKYLALELTEAERGGVFSDAYEHYGYYTRPDFIALATALQLPEKAARRAIDGLLRHQAKIQALIDRAFIGEEQKQALDEAVRRRARALATG